MNKLKHFALVILLAISGMTTVLAVSLEKYGSQPNYKSVPKVKKSPRDIAVETAVQDLVNAKPEKRDRLVREYSRRAKSALDKGNDDEARFYNEILSRAGY